MAMIRRFVNIVAESYSTKNSGVSVYSLHRLDVSKHLFFPSTAHAVEATALAPKDGTMVMEKLELPPPCTRIERVQTDVENISTIFFGLLVGNPSNDGRIFYLDHRRQSFLYDAEESATSLLPTLKGGKGRQPILFSVAAPEDQNQPAEDIYVMATAPHGEPSWGSCFDVLRLGKTDWQALAPPPFVYSLGYDIYDPAFICSHTMVDGGRTICVSFMKGFGTYCFDTVEHAWGQVGEWVLPFDGGAEYTKDLNLWLGFSRENPYELCWTQDLSSMVTDQPPQSQGVWQDIVTPEDWFLTNATLVNLGSGRFCIARLFQIKSDDDTLDYLDERQFTVLTGVEISGGTQGPSLLKHKSVFYQFEEDEIQSVL